ncbi:MAG: dockerin type I repeat-containing protein, partial [Lentisphaeria bacterium]|nr:dockerin type I repeat-containing protein [Candidatus Neomarinimicrobiota bacterium]MCF7842052.1 dockerin type I repeat-containing protein [Lentisphaeria bacterium]
GQAPEFYFHVYNLLGDPGLRIWTDTPQEILVSHPDSVQFGDRSVTVQVRGTNGEPIQGAFVYLKSAMNALGYETDEQGRVSLPVVVDGSDISLTVTGRNLRPWLATIPVSATPHDLSLIDIDWQGAVPLTGGDEGYLTLVLEGGTERVMDVELSLECNSPWVTVLQAQDLIPMVTAGAILSHDSQLAIRIEAGVPDSTLAFLRIGINTGTENRVEQFPLLLQNTRLTFPSVEMIQGNPAPGDSVQVRLTLMNGGSLAAEPGTGMLAFSPGVSSSVSAISWPSLEPGEVLQIPEPVTLHFDASLFPGESITAMLIAGMDTLQQTFFLSPPGPYDPSVPDAYGYRVFDDMDLAYSKAPDYAWYEIDRLNTGPGQPLPIYDPEDERDAAVVVDLPFPVKYYGRTYHEVTICSNGWLAMGRSGEVNFRNRTIPSPMGPAAMLAPFWDDLYTNPGRVSHYAMPDGSSYIVEWKNMANAYTGQLESFQVVILNDTIATPTGDNEILFLYQEFNNVDGYENYATVGIESPDYATGQQVTYANRYDSSLLPLGAERALLFTTARGERLPAAAIMVDQTALHFTVNPWDWAADSIAITNVGESPLLYTITPVAETAGDMTREGSPSIANPRVNTTPEKTKGAEEPLVSRSVRDSVDAFGYQWRDQHDPSTPPFAWVNVEQPGNLITNPTDPDDAVWGPLPVGFDFPFYGESFDEIWICSNGLVSFSHFEGPQFYNWPLPSVNAPANLIAAWWDDLNGGTTASGSLFVRSNSVDSCVITYRDFPRWGTSSTYTFQVILEIDGTITIQYGDMEGPRTSATIGIQNGTADMGLTALYNNYNTIEAGSVIQFLRPNSWFNTSDWRGTIGAGETGYFSVQIIARGLEPGSYSMPLLLQSNAGNESEIPIAVQVDVELGTPPPGDVNLDYRVDLLDFNLMLALITQQTEPTPTQLSAGDLYPDGRLDVLDLVRLLEQILNQPAALIEPGLP